MAYSGSTPFFAKLNVSSPITANGNVTVKSIDFPVCRLIVNVTVVSGTAPTLVFTAQELDPGDETTAIGPAVSTATISAVGVHVIEVPLVLGSVVKISWVVGGTTPSFTTYATLVGKDWTSGSEPTFNVLAPDVAIGNNKSMLALQNNSGRTLKLQEVWIRNAQTTAVAGVVAHFKLFRITSVTGGTSLTPTSRGPTSLASGVSAVTDTTVGGEAATPEDHVEWSSDDWGTGPLDQEGYEHGQQVAAPTFNARAGANQRQEPWILQPGQGMHVKHATNSTAGTFDVLFVFTQV